jgi:hypothetical protein
MEEDSVAAAASTLQRFVSLPTHLHPAQLRHHTIHFHLFES